jgi:hypothetical protein
MKNQGELGEHKHEVMEQLSNQAGQEAYEEMLINTAKAKGYSDDAEQLAFVDGAFNNMSATINSSAYPTGPEQIAYLDGRNYKVPTTKDKPMLVDPATHKSGRYLHLPNVLPF